jgi:hypothetical protein
MGYNQESSSIENAINTIPEEDLVFIATYNPQVFKQMCLMLSLEKQLNIEGKSFPNSVILEARKPEEKSVSLWYKFKQWLYSGFIKMGLKK